MAELGTYFRITTRTRDSGGWWMAAVGLVTTWLGFGVEPGKVNQLRVERRRGEVVLVQGNLTSERLQTIVRAFRTVETAHLAAALDAMSAEQIQRLVLELTEGPRS